MTEGGKTLEVLYYLVCRPEVTHFNRVCVSPHSPAAHPSTSISVASGPHRDLTHFQTFEFIRGEINSAEDPAWRKVINGKCETSTCDIATSSTSCRRLPETRLRDAPLMRAHSANDTQPLKNCERPQFLTLLQLRDGKFSQLDAPRDPVTDSDASKPPVHCGHHYGRETRWVSVTIWEP